MKKGYLYIIVTIVMFTSYEVVLRYIAGQINSMQLTLCRFSVGFLILLPLALRTLKRRGKRLDGRSMARFALLGPSSTCRFGTPGPLWPLCCSAATRYLSPFWPSFC